MKRIAVLAGVLAIAVAAPAGAAVPAGVTPGHPDVVLPAAAGHATDNTGVVPGGGLATAATAGAPVAP
jgi:hypothetical protein